MDLDGGDTSTEQQHEPVAMLGEQRARVLGKRRDDVLDSGVFVDSIGIVEGDVDAVTADEPDPQHDVRHGRRIDRMPELTSAR